MITYLRDLYKIFKHKRELLINNKNNFLNHKSIITNQYQNNNFMMKLDFKEEIFIL